MNLVYSIIIKTVNKLKGKKVYNLDKLKNLKKRNILNCDPEEIVHIEWLKDKF